MEGGVEKWRFHTKMRLQRTSGQSNLTTGRIAAAHGRFNGVHQVARLCTPHIILGPPESKSHTALVHPFLRSSRKRQQAAPPSLKIALPMEAWLSGSALVSINEVILHPARLVLGWVTLCEHKVYPLWLQTTSVCNQPLRPTQPSTLSRTENQYRPKCKVR